MGKHHILPALALAGGLVGFAGILLTIYFFATKDSKKSN